MNVEGASCQAAKAIVICVLHVHLQGCYLLPVKLPHLRRSSYREGEKDREEGRQEWVYFQVCTFSIGCES